MKKIVCIIAFLAFAVYILHSYKDYRTQAQAINIHNQATMNFEECLGAFDWKCAEENLKILYEESPEDTVLQINMAVVLLEQERYEECVNFVNGLPRLFEKVNFIKEKALLLQKELAELQLEKSFHFRLEYDGNPSRKDVQEALSVLEVAYDSISGLFNFDPPNKLCIVLYEAQEHTGVGLRPDWVGAVFDGKLRVPADVMTFREVYRPMLFHELTHSFIRGMTHMEVPFWINEGIAQMVDGSRKNQEKPNGPAPTLNELTGSFVKENNAAKAERLYWYSYKMIEALFRRNESFEHFRKFIQEMKAQGVAGALDKYYSVTAEQLLEEVK